MPRAIVLFNWRVQSEINGKWITTRYKATEEDIRRQHPEAIAVEHTREERTVSDDPYTITLGHVQRGPSK